MKPIELREADFKRSLKEFPYPEFMKEEFFNYWSEPNKSGTKMRYETEKTWHLGRRLARWANSPFGNKGLKTAENAPKTKVEPTNEFEKLDLFIEHFTARPTEIPFEEFGRWYEFMKGEKLLKKYLPQEVEELKAWYNNDNVKCRCAVVQQTLTGYVNSGIRIKDIIQLRQRLNGVR